LLPALLLLALLSVALAAEGPAGRASPQATARPFFPIGLYLAIWWEPDNMARLAQAGFNRVGPRGDMEPPGRYRDFLDAAHSQGMRAWVTLRRSEWWDADLSPDAPTRTPLEERRRWIAEMVTALKDHPALLVWDLCDEVNISGRPVEGFLAGRNLVRTLDPEEIRFMTYDAIVAGATGVLYFGQDVSVGWTEGFREGLFTITRQLRDLTPALLGQDEPVMVEDPWTPLRWRCKRVGGARYLFAVNPWVRPVRAAFVFLAVGAFASAEVILPAEGIGVEHNRLSATVAAKNVTLLALREPAPAVEW